MLTRQSLWVPTLTHMPLYEKAWNGFFRRNPHSVDILRGVQHHVGDTRVLLCCGPNSTNETAHLMASRFTIRSAACDSTPDGRVMAIGAITSLVDTFTSMHVMQRLLPATPGHVSVNIQTNLLRHVREGDTVVFVSKMDKLGKRLAYTSAELLLDTEEVGAEFAQAEQNAKTLEEVERLLRRYPVLANGKHVKCILS